MPRHAVAGWIAENLEPHVRRLSTLRRHVFGEDFARNRDQAVTVVGEEDTDLTHRPRIVIELSNCPFKCQEQIHEHCIDRMPRFRGGAMDATGNGAALAEKMAQRFGVEMIEQVKLNDGFYLAHMPKLRAGLQDGTLDEIPRDEPLQDDLRAIKLVQGIPKVPRDARQSTAQVAAAAEGGGKRQRHGDFAIALFLMLYAFFREAGEIAWQSIPTDRGRMDEGAGFDSRPDRMRNRPADASRDQGWMVDSGRKGGW